MDIKRIAVVGAGTMGNGIAQVCATSGYDVTLIDVNNEILERALQGINDWVDRLHGKGILNDEQKAGVSNISTANVLEAASAADFIIEAATERLDLKLKIFSELDAIARPEVILASNTSSISLTEIGAATRRPEKVIGMHFMNPVPLMQLVEVIRGLRTSDETAQLTVSLSEKLGKTPVEANDFPGFISNRILAPMLNEAIYVLMEGVGTAEAIDTVMKMGMNHPMGPLELADLIGLDVLLSILEVLREGFGDDKYRACPLLKKMVAAGHLGKKSGKGFYEYP